MRFLVEAANATVAVEDGVVIERAGRFDHVVHAIDCDVRPGLINAHDHLHRNHYGRLGAPPYENAYAWGHDIHRRFAPEIERGRCVPRREALRYGAWKNLFAGVTTVVHHDAWMPELAELPVRVAHVRCAHSLGFDGDAVVAGHHDAPFAVHVAEGTDRRSADEVRELDARGVLDANLLAVHVVGADADGVQRLADARAAVVWCPTSNEFLFGRTASGDLLSACDVLLGSDSLLTGEGNLLDELRRARALGVVSDRRLVAAVGCLAARRLRMPAPSLEPGAPADLVVLRRPLLECSAHDVALVVCAGVPRVWDPQLGAPMDWAAPSRAMQAFGVARVVRDA